MSERYKTELHCHTCEASGCADESAALTVEKYIAHGYTTVVLTNHFGAQEFDEDEPGAYDAMIDRHLKALKLAEEAAAGRINVLMGMELRIKCNNNDYLVFGATEEVLRKSRPMLDMDIWGAHAYLNDHGAIVIHAHPMRTGSVVTDPESVDGYEVYNGHNDQRSRNEMALMWGGYARALRRSVILTSGSDKHDRHHVPDAGIYTDVPITSVRQLVEVLESGKYRLIRGDLAGCEM